MLTSDISGCGVLDCLPSPVASNHTPGSGLPANDLHRQFDADRFRAEVCSLKFREDCFMAVFSGISGIRRLTSQTFFPDSLETDDRGTHAEKKGPLFYVTHVTGHEKESKAGKSGQRAPAQMVQIRLRPGGLDQTNRTYFLRTSE